MAKDGWSWLRSPRYDANSLADVYADGILSGAFYWKTNGGLRPAFWVDITSAE